MLGDLFGDEDDMAADFADAGSGQAAAAQANVQARWPTARKPAHLAADLDLPVQARQDSNLCGLVNQ